MVIKPAEDTPLSAIYLARLAREVGIPDGVINVVPGYGPVAGAALAAHPGLKRMSFTGSPEVGRLIGRRPAAAISCRSSWNWAARGRRWSSTTSPLTPTVGGLVQAITLHTGQVCCDATRWLVQRPIYDRFVAAAAGGCGGADRPPPGPGHPDGPGGQREAAASACWATSQRGREEGAEVLLEGGTAEVPGYDGFYVKPALLAGSLDNVAAREEIFGPVAYLAPFDDEQQAVGMVNQTDYGLANSVWTSDLARAARVAEAMLAGNSWINAHNLFPHGVPYAGINRSGLGGGVLSAETLLDYWRNVSVVRPL